MARPWEKKRAAEGVGERDDLSDWSEWLLARLPSHAAGWWEEIFEHKQHYEAVPENIYAVMAGLADAADRARGQRDRAWRALAAIEGRLASGDLSVETVALHLAGYLTPDDLDEQLAVLAAAEGEGADGGGRE